MRSAEYVRLRDGERMEVPGETPTGTPKELFHGAGGRWDLTLVRSAGPTG